MLRRSAAAAAAAVLCALLLLLHPAASQEGDVPESYAASFAARFAAPPSWSFPNPRLRAAYAALQAWKRTAIFSDPSNFTGNWVGPNVCAYNGVFCAPLPGSYGHDGDLVVAGIDLNHADIAGYLPASLPLGVPDLALLHLNSNRFCGVVPTTFRRLHLLHELDLSNNRFVGAFPEVVLSLPSLKYLDLRFNEFEGSLPPALFDRPLDAIFVNSNRLRNPIPANLGNSPASVVVLAHNRLGGCIPPSIGRMAGTLNEIVLIADELVGCVPPQVGLLKKVTVFDVSDNHLQGQIPASVAGMVAVEELDFAGNRFEGAVPAGVCGLVALKNLTYTNNFISSRPSCAKATADGAWNCAVSGCGVHAHHAGGIGASFQGTHHAVLPVSAVERDHAVAPLAADSGAQHPVAPLAADPGAHHPVVPAAAVQRDDTRLTTCHRPGSPTPAPSTYPSPPSSSSTPSYHHSSPPPQGTPTPSYPSPSPPVTTHTPPPPPTSADEPDVRYAPPPRSHRAPPVHAAVSRWRVFPASLINGLPPATHRAPRLRLAATVPPGLPRAADDAVVPAAAPLRAAASERQRRR
ncbi:hypothetical protein PR202_gb06178 [Eleusine coracana subsp. coracana]|uniref:Cell wall hydroxyproline-rich glycoprotein n=1 Tax=Eleusine coracana subsp. coracana TaxID=191504 RepID=A0AAV5E914_ELECO|nr:hypothetical protein PR202_gb06178 [Eleusine coracana subsp. coracana]